RRCTGVGPRSAAARGRATLRFRPRISDSVSIRMTVVGVDTIAIVVSDPRKAIEWYRDVLGLDVAYIGPSDSNPDPTVQWTAENPGHWVELGPARPRTRVHLCFMRGETEPGPSGITFITDDIQADYERMRSQGVEFPLPPEKMEWGEWLGQFADLDGNVSDLKQRSASTSRPSFVKAFPLFNQATSLCGLMSSAVSIARKASSYRPRTMRVAPFPYQGISAPVTPGRALAIARS